MLNATKLKLISLLGAMLAAGAGPQNRGRHDPLSKLYIKTAKTKVMKRSSFRETERRRKQIASGRHPVVYSWKDPSRLVSPTQKEKQ